MIGNENCKQYPERQQDDESIQADRPAAEVRRNRQHQVRPRDANLRSQRVGWRPTCGAAGSPVINDGDFISNEIDPATGTFTGKAGHYHQYQRLADLRLQVQSTPTITVNNGCPYQQTGITRAPQWNHLVAEGSCSLLGQPHGGKLCGNPALPRWQDAEYDFHLAGT